MSRELVWVCPRCHKGWNVEDGMRLHCPTCGMVYDSILISKDKFNDIKKENEDLRKGLERIKQRASKIMQGHIKCTNFSAALYNHDVAEKALGKKGG